MDFIQAFKETWLYQLSLFFKLSWLIFGARMFVRLYARIGHERTLLICTEWEETMNHD